MESSRPQTPTTTLTRLRWDNIMIGVVGLALAAAAALWITLGAGDASPAAVVTPTPAATSGSTVAAVDPDMSLDAANARVDEARDFVQEGRWDEATDRLDSIPATIAPQTGAAALRADLTDRRARHTALRSQLTAAIEARNWRDARETLTALDAIVPLDDELVGIRATVRANLAGTTSGGGDTSKDATAPASTLPTKSTDQGTTKVAADSTKVDTPAKASRDFGALLADLDPASYDELLELLEAKGIDESKLAALQKAFEQALTPKEIGTLNSALTDALGADQIAALEAALGSTKG